MPRTKRNRSHPAGLPEVSVSGYRALLTDIKARIRTSQIKAALSINRELIRLYWDIGGLIVNRQRVEGWGKSVVEKLASDVQNDFPGIEGFSPRNIWRMRAFRLAWERNEAPTDVEHEFVPQAVAEIPWGHNVILLEKLHGTAQRLWYAQQATANGWSRAMLVHWIDSELYSRQGKAVTNFKTALPPPQSDLANAIVRDPLQLRLSDAPRASRGAGAGGRFTHSHPQVSDRAGHRFCLRRTAGSPSGRWGGFLHRPAFLSPETALLYCHRSQDDEVQARIRWKDEFLSFGCGRPTSARR